MGLVHHVVCLFTPRFLHRYQCILLGDRGTWVWTTCLQLLPGSAAAGGWTHNIESQVQH